MGRSGKLRSVLRLHFGRTSFIERGTRGAFGRQACLRRAFPGWFTRDPSIPATRDTNPVSCRLVR